MLPIKEQGNVLHRLLAKIYSVSKCLSTCRSSIYLDNTLQKRGLFFNKLVQNICLTVFHLFRTLPSICSDNSLWHWPKDSAFDIPLSQNLTLFKGPFPLPTLFWCIQKKGLISWLFDCCCCCPLSGHAVPRPEDA